MKRVVLRSVLILGLSLFLGCPYESPSPTGQRLIGQKLVQPEISITGIWTKVNKFYIHISKLGESDYLIIANDGKKLENIDNVARGFFTQVGAKQVFNVQFLADQGGYHPATKLILVRLAMKGESLCYDVVEKEFATKALNEKKTLDDILIKEWENPKLWEEGDCLDRVE